MFVLGSGRPSTFTFPEGLGGSISVSSARNGRAFSLARRSERQDKFTMSGTILRIDFVGRGNVK